jgi:hypothetical protein
LSQPPDGARRETIILVGNLNHCLFADRIGYLARKRAGFLSALTPVFGIVVEQRHRIPQAAAQVFHYSRSASSPAGASPLVAARIISASSTASALVGRDEAAGGLPIDQAPDHHVLRRGVRDAGAGSG